MTHFDKGVGAKNSRMHVAGARARWEGSASASWSTDAEALEREALSSKDECCTA